MASTARKESEKKEYFDPPPILQRKVDQLVSMIRESKHMIIFTGAGISTGAGIPDFRSGMNTSLQTGPGVWELQSKKTSRDKKHKVTTTLKAIPTATHMMIVKLYEVGILKRCISQNTDGLHRRSGLPKLGLCELHGNTNLERCKKCGKEFLRDFKVRNSKRVHKHLTGRECDDPSCRGPLVDSIINFGENLPETELTNAEQEGETADLCLAMGSSLTVTPAADIPEEVAKRGKQLVIVNLQKTPLDIVASLVIHAKCEEVSAMIMSKLGLELPEFKLRRKLLITCSPETSGSINSVLTVVGKDMDELPFVFFKEVQVKAGENSYTLSNQPFQTSLKFKDESNQLNISIQITTHSYYGEPPFFKNIIVKRGKEFSEQTTLVYSTQTGQWQDEQPTSLDDVATSVKTLTVT